MSSINGKSILIGIVIFMVLILIAFYFLYFRNLDSTHPLKAVLSTLPFFDKESSRQLTEEEKLEEERIRVEQEWARIESEKKQLADMEAQLAKKENELEDLERELIAEREKLENAITNIKELARYYELMEPKSAAGILENIEDELLIQLLLNMRKELASEILSNLDAKRAAAITKKMSGL